MERYLQLNCGRRIVSTVFCSQQDYDIGFLQEINLGYKSELRRARNLYTAHDKPRAVITSKKELSLVSNCSSRDIVTAVNTAYLFCSIYLAMDDEEAEPTLQLLEKAIAFGSRSGKKIIIAGDANARSSLWGCSTTCQRGERIENLLITFGLSVRNEGDHPTFSTRVGESIIDITVSTVHVANWRVRDDLPAGSDHLPITFESEPSTEVVPKARPNWKKANWPVLINSLEEYASEVKFLGAWSEEKLDRRVEALNSKFETLIKSCVPDKRPKNTETIWWTDECENAKKMFRKAKHAHSRRKTQESWDNYELTKSVYTTCIAKAKQDSWRSFVNNTNGLNEIAKLKNILTTASSRKVGLLKTQTGSTASSMKESLSILLNEHFPGSKPFKSFKRHSQKEHIIRDDLQWINSTNFHRATSSFKVGKAPGPDGVTVELMQKLGPIMTDYICTLYKASMTLSYVPRAWKTAKTIFIDKPGKDDYSKPRSWRPITLLSCQLKTLEKLIAGQLEEHFLTKPLSNSQYGFRSGRSCDHALSKIINKLEKSKEQRQAALMLALDIEGAFDRVRVSAITNAMRKRNISETLVKWVENFLRQRKTKTEMNGEIAEIEILIGVAQGGVLSSFLWNIVIDELLQEFEQGPVSVTAYADDASFVCSGFTDVVYDLMQRAIKTAEAWSERTGLKFSASKTQLMLVTNKRKFPRKKLSIYGNEIEEYNCIKVLGLDIDKDLNFSAHIGSRISKAKRILMATKSVMSKIWGPRPELVRWILEGVVNPIITYAAHVWWNKITATIRSKLSSLQRLGLCMIAPVRPSTPSAALEIIYDSCPLWLAAKKRAMMNYIRIMPLMGNEVNWHSYTKKRGHLCPLLVEESFGDLKLPNERVEPRYEEPLYEVEISDGKPVKSQIEIYTDGSKLDGKSGAGALIRIEDKDVLTISERLCDTTVFIAEISAIISSLLYLEKLDPQSKDIRFMVDNQATLKSLMQPKSNHRLIIEAKRKLNRLAKWNRIKLAYIEAHSNWTGNEIADLAAKKGSNSIRKTDLSIYTSIEAKNYVKELILKDWRDLFESTPGLRQTRLMISGPDLNIWNNIKKLDKTKIGRLVRFYTGHAWLRRHQSLVDKNNTDISCRLCGRESEESFHILATCPVLADWRADTLGFHVGVDSRTWNSLNIALFLDHEIIRNLENGEN